MAEKRKEEGGTAENEGGTHVEITGEPGTGGAVGTVDETVTAVDREAQMAAEYEAASHLRTACSLARAAHRLYITKKVVAARELGQSVVEEIVAYEECVQAAHEIGLRGETFVGA